MKIQKIDVPPPCPGNGLDVSTVDNYEEAISALNSGRHCIVQKLFTPESGHAEHLVSLARNKGLSVFVWKVPSPAASTLTVARPHETPLPPPAPANDRLSVTCRPLNKKS